MSTPFHRTLVIRGGALGDFLLTLPVLASLREAAPDSRLELLAYPGPAGLAKAAGLADAVRPIEYGPLAGFFSRDAELDPGLRDYFASFDLVLSYLYDPDSIFSDNLRNSGVRKLVQGPHRISDGSHAIDQLAAPLEHLSLPMTGRAVRLNLGATAGDPFVVALHPGSGSTTKNWPAPRWKELALLLLEALPADGRLAVIGGEADAAATDLLRPLTADHRVDLWENLPLPDLARRLSGARCYIGHDTGISHLAAAAGTPSLLLFGPTDPGIWAPPHDHVRILRAPGGDWAALPVHAVFSAAQRLLPPARLARGGPESDHPSP